MQQVEVLAAEEEVFRNQSELLLCLGQGGKARRCNCFGCDNSLEMRRGEGTSVTNVILIQKYSFCRQTSNYDTGCQSTAVKIQQWVL